MTVNNFTRNLNTATLAGLSNQVYTTFDNTAATTSINGWSYDATATTAAASSVGSQLDSLGRPVNLSLIHPQVWSDGAGNHIVVFRGTADAQDARTDRDLINLYGSNSIQPPPALTAAAAFVSEVVSNTSGNVVVTGHSLGGTETLYAVDQVTANNADYLNRVSAVTFNPAAVPASLVAQRTVGAGAPAISFVAAGDPVANLTQTLGGTLLGDQITIDSGPSANQSFFALSEMSTSIDVFQLSEGSFERTTNGAGAAGAILNNAGIPIGGHSMEGLTATFQSSYATIDSSIGSSGNIVSLQDLLAVPWNSDVTSSITNNASWLAIFTQGFGQGSQITPVPGLTIDFSGSDGTGFQIEGGPTADWLSINGSLDASGILTNSIAIYNDGSRVEANFNGYSASDPYGVGGNGGGGEFGGTQSVANEKKYYDTNGNLNGVVTTTSKGKVVSQGRFEPNSAVAAIAATTPLPATDPGNDNLSCTRLVA